ncbi:metallophosphoesterase family protein [Rhodophyticola sp.]|jgi:serine/threonine protein phosphatase 1|uniref:metallophosphoesterase family protein n=1 Tax=Rhodophyticola sp. TaxID=2680032 RepID=UPI001B24AA2E|nr:serine/threonine protein phosphatase [Roseicyclus sp.]MBO6923920.1 serine/threonine protein phosphatase [Roseicyclus sp.]
MRTYAIGDIHGHLDKLELAHELIATDRAACGDETAPIVHIGDLVDRGPDSAGVLRYLRARQQADARIVVLKGNHEQMLDDFLTNPPGTDDAQANGYLRPGIGGRATLASFGMDPDAPTAELQRDAQANVSPSEHAFITSLPLTFLHGACLFVHAGIRPGLPLEQQDPEDLIWIRKDFLESTEDHGLLVVHGHTPIERVEHHGNRLNIDTGAAFGGPLSAIVIEGRAAWLLSPSGRLPV